MRIARYWLICLGLTLCTPSAVFAEEEKKEEVKEEQATEENSISEESSTTKDEYDFSWLDPDKKIYVVQNRKYTKANSLEFSLSAGLGFGEPYRSTYMVLPRGTFYFSESFGISALGTFSSTSENNNFRELKSVSSVVPSVRDTVSWMGASAVWVPFYAKINMFNTILYVDWQFELGGAYVQSEIDLNSSATGSANVKKNNYVGGFWGTGQKFFLSRDWAVRFDFFGLYYRADTARSGFLTQNREMDENYYFTIGMSYTF